MNHWSPGHRDGSWDCGRAQVPEASSETRLTFKTRLVSRALCF